MKRNKAWTKEYKIEYDKQYGIKWRLKNKEKLKAYRVGNKENQKIYAAAWYQRFQRKKAASPLLSQQYKEDRHKQYLKHRIKHKAYQVKHRKHYNYIKRTWTKHMYNTNTHYKIRLSMASRIKGALKKGWKSATTKKLIGCTIDHFKKHLEKQFKPGMTWQNHAKDGWHIDHIIPCASFNLECPVQQLACFHYSNTQPLWAVDNLKKGAR